MESQHQWWWWRDEEECLTIWVDVMWARVEGTLHAGCNENWKQMGWRKLHWFHTEMTTIGSREQNGLKVWQQRYDWLTGIVEKSNKFTERKNTHTHLSSWIKERGRERINETHESLPEWTAAKPQFRTSENVNTPTVTYLFEPSLTVI